MKNSRIRKEIAERGLATCMKINTNDPRIVELAGLCGFSAVWLCNEHVPGDWLGIENSVRAAKLHDVDTIVRIAKGSYSDYIKPFECDATAIMVPHVTSAGEARAIVDQCRFMPLGRRALDGGNVDGAFATIPGADYIAASNREKLIILQIESPEGVEAVDEIAAVEGFDFLLFGPGDYAHRIGKVGQIHAPEVTAARLKVEEACRRHGKLGFAVGAPGSPGELRERGYGVLNLASDVGSLAAAFKNLIAGFNDNLAQSDNYYAKKA